MKLQDSFCTKINSQFGENHAFHGRRICYIIYSLISICLSCSLTGRAV